MTPTPQPADAEREAREVVMLAVANGFERVGIKARVESLESSALDAYRLAVRRSLLAEIVGAVERMVRLGDDGFDNLTAKKDGWLIDRDSVLTYLHGLAPETDR